MTLRVEYNDGRFILTNIVYSQVFDLCNLDTMIAPYYSKEEEFYYPEDMFGEVCERLQQLGAKVGITLDILVPEKELING